jgi:hypothetical protein
MKEKMIEDESWIETQVASLILHTQSLDRDSNKHRYLVTIVIYKQICIFDEV